MHHHIKRVFVVAILLTAMTAAAQQRGPGVRFRFAFGALTGTGANEKLLSITQDTALRTGDRFKMMREWWWGPRAVNFESCSAQVPVGFRVIFGIPYALGLRAADKK